MDIRNSVISPVLWLIAGAVLISAMPAHAADYASEPVILVAKPGFRDRLYGETILIAKPVGNDEHIGFIVNRPTRMTLGRVFPDHEPSKKVTEPIYLGGPVSTGTLFALVRRQDNPGSHSVQMMSDLYLVIDRDLVDRVIETEAERARFYAGLVLWTPGELRAEIRRGFWYVLDPDASLVLRKSTEGMWEELVRQIEQKTREIRAGNEPLGIRTPRRAGSSVTVPAGSSAAA
jgi:putative transcriptional regulator